MLRRLLIIVALGSLFVPALALADVIAEITMSGNDFVIADTGTGNLTTITNAPVSFKFENVPSSPINNVLLGATLNLTGSTSDSVTGTVNSLTQLGYGGTFVITNGTYGILLSGVFGPTGTLTGGGSSLVFSDSDVNGGPYGPGGEVVLSSQYLLFDNTSQESFSLSLGMHSNITFDTVGSNTYITNDIAGGTGTFDSTPPPEGTPEPASMFLSGGALLGLGMLLRKRKA